MRRVSGMFVSVLPVLLATIPMAGCYSNDFIIKGYEKSDAGPLPTPPPVVKEGCDVKSDCTPNDPSKAKYFICTPRKTCIKICFAKSDCASDELCEDSQCRRPACGADSECGADEVCSAGACVQKPFLSEVASCEIQPPEAVLHEGVAKNFRIVARDNFGDPLHYVSTGESVVWNSAGHTLDLDPANHLNATIVGSDTKGAGHIEASIGNVKCDRSAVANFLAVPEGKLRVVTVSTGRNAVINDATVRVNDVEQTHDNEDGEYLFDAPEGPATITVTSPHTNSVRLVDVTTRDVLVYLKPTNATVKFTGKMTPRAFDNLQDVKGTVHLAVSGPAIHGSLNDIDLATLWGDPVPTTIDLGGSTKTDTDLPEGMSIGLAENMFKDRFAVNVEGGVRTFWNFGGNVVLSDVLGVVSQATGGGDVDYGAILSALLPVFGRLQAGALPFQTVVDPGDLNGLKLRELLRLQSKVKVPALTSYQLNGETTYPEAAIVIGGVHERTQGFVPRGFSAGVDKDQNRLVDAQLGGSEGAVAIRMAPSAKGLEESENQVVLLTGKLDNFFSRDTTSPRVVSASVAKPGKILFKDNATNSIALPPTISVPDTLQLSESSFSHSGVAGAEMHRLDIGDWVIYFPSTSTTIDLTGVPRSDKVSLHSMRLEMKSGVDYQSVLRFDGDDLDDLSNVMDAFSVRSLTSQDITQ